MSQEKPYANALNALECHGRIYILGYGSLCYPSGINGRGMKYQYDWSDLQPVVLNRYERSFCAPYSGTIYYGIVENPKKHCNGVIFPVRDPHDLVALATSEEIGLVYDLTSVTWCVSVTLDAEHERPIFACIARNQPDELARSHVSASYARNVHHGIQHWGTEFVDEFILTTTVDDATRELLDDIFGPMI